MAGGGLKCQMKEVAMGGRTHLPTAGSTAEHVQFPNNQPLLPKGGGRACFSKQGRDRTTLGRELIYSWNNWFICQGSKSGSYLKRTNENAGGRREKGDRNSNLIWKEQNVISRGALLVHENIFIFSGCSTPF